MMRHLVMMMMGLMGLAIQGHLCEGPTHDFSHIEGFSYSKAKMEVRHMPEELHQCIHFSIRIMHRLVEYEDVYARMSEFTPNIATESYYLLLALKEPGNGFAGHAMSDRLKGNLMSFIDHCVELMSPPPIADEEDDGFSQIPHYFFSKAMMEVRHMQPKNKCVNFSLRLMHHLADRKPVYASYSVYTEGIDRISGGVIKTLMIPGKIRTDDMKEKFKNELTSFIGNCHQLLNLSNSKEPLVLS